MQYISEKGLKECVCACSISDWLPENDWGPAFNLWADLWGESRPSDGL